MKIIFLDLMGTLFTDYARAQQPKGCEVLLDSEQVPAVDLDAIAALNTILDADPETFVCLHSTMRREFMIGAIKHFFEQLGLRKDRLIYQTPESTRGYKGHEISLWLEETGIRRHCGAYVILDDEWITEHAQAQVKLGSYRGITMGDAEEALRLLQ